MGKIVYAALMPHPPIIIPEVGGKELEKARATVSAMEQAANMFCQAAPDTVVIISPHGSVFSDAVAITADPVLEGSLGKFGAPRVTFNYPNDPDLVAAISRAAKARGTTVTVMDRILGRKYGVDTRLDHGMMVPLYYLRRAGWTGSVVPVAMGLLSLEELYSFGVALQKAVATRDRRVAVIASGDLSHRLTPGAPAGFGPEGEVFDNRVRDSVSRCQAKALIAMPEDLIEKAGQCGLRPLMMMLGALDGLAVQPRELAYEGPFGVGYLVAVMNPGGAEKEREWETTLFKERAERREKARSTASEPVRLAWASLEAYIREGRVLRVPAHLPPELAAPAGVFVSLKKNGQLRGCIGTTGPTRPSAAAEIIYNACEAGSRDPRFDPVEPEELDELDISVDILKEPEPVASLAELDPNRYGVIVRSGRRCGLLLPDLEGVDTAEEQVGIACRKAGIDPGENYRLEKFEVVRYH